MSDQPLEQRSRKKAGDWYFLRDLSRTFACTLVGMSAFWFFYTFALDKPTHAYMAYWLSGACVVVVLISVLCWRRAEYWNKLNFAHKLAKV